MHYIALALQVYYLNTHDTDQLVSIDIQSLGFPDLFVDDPQILLDAPWRRWPSQGTHPPVRYQIRAVSIIPCTTYRNLFKFSLQAAK